MLKTRLKIELSKAMCFGRQISDRETKKYVGYVNRRNFGDDLLFDIYSQISDGPILPVLDLYSFQKRLSGPTILGGGTILGGKIYAKALDKMSPPEFVFCAGVIPDSLDGYWSNKLAGAKILTRSVKSSEALCRIGVDSQAFVDPGIFSSKIYIDKDSQFIDRSRNNPIILAPHGLHPYIEWYKGFLRSIGSNVTFFAAHPTDLAVIRELIRPKDNLVLGWKNIPDSINLIRNAQLVVSTRLHPAVCAASFKVPFYLVEYEEKQTEFAESIGLVDRIVPKTRLQERFDTDLLSRTIDWKTLDDWLGRFDELVGVINKIEGSRVQIE